MTIKSRETCGLTYIEKLITSSTSKAKNSLYLTLLDLSLWVDHFGVLLVQIPSNCWNSRNQLELLDGKENRKKKTLVVNTRRQTVRKLTSPPTWIVLITSCRLKTRSQSSFVHNSHLIRWIEPQTNWPKIVRHSQELNRDRLLISRGI